MSNIVLKGSTSGDVTITVPAEAGSNTITIPATTGTMLDTNSVIASSKLPAGSIRQVVNATITGVNSTTGTTYVTSSVTAAITPSSTSSKIIVMMCSSVYISGANQQASTTIFRGSTNLGNSARGIVQYWDTGDLFQGNASMVLTDSPSSTSAVTYALYFRKLSSGGDAVYIGVDNTTQFITLLEVQG